MKSLNLLSILVEVHNTPSSTTRSKENLLSLKRNKQDHLKELTLLYKWVYYTEEWDSRIRRFKFNSTEVMANNMASPNTTSSCLLWSQSTELVPNPMLYSFLLPSQDIQ